MGERDLGVGSCAAPGSTGGGPLRRVVMFHLRPHGTAAATDTDRPARRTVQPELVTPYRRVDPNQKAAPRDPFEIDPDVVDRGLRGHAQTQELLAALVRVHGLEPLSPGPGDPNFDLAWKDGGAVTVVEVKSLTNANELVRSASVSGRSWTSSTRRRAPATAGERSWPSRHCQRSTPNGARSVQRTEWCSPGPSGSSSCSGEPASSFLAEDAAAHRELVRCGNGHSPDRRKETVGEKANQGRQMEWGRASMARPTLNVGSAYSSAGGGLRNPPKSAPQYWKSPVRPTCRGSAASHWTW